MRSLVGPAMAAALFTLSAASAALAHEPRRLYVAPYGADSNDCSRANPCRTFAGAYNKSDAYEGSEINCLEAGGYGPLIIRKSFSIVCDAKLGGITANAAVSASNPETGYAVLVKAGATDVVYLRGLNIDGTGGAIDGARSNARAGIRVESAGSVFIDDCVIRNFNNSIDGGFGIQIAASLAMKFVISRCSIFNTGQGNLGASIQVRPTAAVSVSGVIDQVIASKSVYGFAGDANGAAALLNLAIRNSVTAQNSIIGIIATTTSTPLSIQVEHTSVTSSGTGIATLANGAGIPTIRIDDVAASANNVGVSGNVQSYGNNKIIANNSDGTVLAVSGGVR